MHSLIVSSLQNDQDQLLTADEVISEIEYMMQVCLFCFGVVLYKESILFHLRPSGIDFLFSRSVHVDFQISFPAGSIDFYPKQNKILDQLQKNCFERLGVN